MIPLGFLKGYPQIINLPNQQIIPPPLRQIHREEITTTFYSGTNVGSHGILRNDSGIKFLRLGKRFYRLPSNVDVLGFVPQPSLRAGLTITPSPIKAELNSKMEAGIGTTAV